MFLSFRYFIFIYFLLIPIILFGNRGGLCDNRHEIKSNGCKIEMPKELLLRDFLIASRVENIEKSSKKQKIRIDSGQRLYDPVWVVFEKEGHNFKIIAKGARCKVRNRRCQTGWYSIPIIKETEKSFVLDFTKFFLNPIIGVDPYNERTAPAPLIDSLNRVLSVNVDNSNVEVRVQYAFENDSKPQHLIVQKSLIVLPENKMKGRLYDSRVGYHTTRVCGKRYINRFRIEPSDKVAYFLGEKTSPVKPIVFYVDDAFPPLWKKAVRAGILDWNLAFNAIGFTDVIKVKNYSEGGMDFNPNDFKNNCFKYVKSDFANAQGKHWVDPRTGEILQADVLFYDDVILLLHKWYFLQTAAYNPIARQKHLPDSVMFRILRYAAAHEIGHCLGLEHNFRASYAFDTDSLRSPNFTSKYGTTPSIMDYARFNYVAQPGDGVINIYPPILGPYDYYSIKVGYQYLQNEEQISNWIESKQNDPLFLCDRASAGVVISDPAVQSRDLGNNNIASAKYGIANLHVILQNIDSWSENQEDVLNQKDAFIDLPISFEDLVDCYFSYVENVIPVIAGCYQYETNTDRLRQEYVSKDESIKAVKFIYREITEGYLFLLENQSNVYDGKLSREEIVLNRREKTLKKLYNNSMKKRIKSAENITLFSYSDYLHFLEK